MLSGVHEPELAATFFRQFVGRAACSLATANQAAIQVCLEDLGVPFVVQFFGIGFDVPWPFNVVREMVIEQLW